MSVENYVVMHVSLENINSSHKKVKGSKKVFTVNWKQSVNGVLIQRALKDDKGGLFCFFPKKEI